MGTADLRVRRGAAALKIPLRATLAKQADDILLVAIVTQKKNYSAEYDNKEKNK